MKRGVALEFLKGVLVTGAVLGLVFALVTVTTKLGFTNPHKELYNYVNVTKVVRVYDGDTIYLDMDGFPPIIGENMPVRIRGIDTPELRGADCEEEKALGIQARDFLVELLVDAERRGVAIRLVDYGRGTFFRLVGDVLVGAERVSVIMIKAGHAVPYSERKIGGWCE